MVSSRAEVASEPVPPVLARATSILSAFEGRRTSLTLQEVVQSSDLPRTTAHRLMNALVKIGWLDRDGLEYRLGSRLLGLGAAASRYDRLRQAALPFLVTLHQATGAWVHLVVRESWDAVYLEQIGDPRRSPLPLPADARLPALCTAAGRVLVAFGGPGRDGLAKDSAMPLSSCSRAGHTLPDGAALRRELAEIRRTGVAVGREECFDGARSVAVPLSYAGWTPAAISVSQPGPFKDPAGLAAQVTHYARAVSDSLFAQGGGPGGQP